MQAIKRRTYLINKPFQYRMILISFVITGPMIALFYCAYAYFIDGLSDKLEYLDRDIATSLISFISETEATMKWFVLVGILFIVAFNSICFLFLSHAIAGPIEKLKRHLKNKSNDEKTGPFFTRSSDFFPELPHLVNQAFKDTVKKDESA